MRGLKTINIPHNNPISNITSSEHRALRDLKSNNDIVVKKADKGGAIVVLNRSDYIEECHRQLNNQRDYTRLTADPTKSYLRILKKILKKAVQENIIDNKISNYLLGSKFKLSKFYCLPKIHKPNCPGRPIINSIDSLTSHISQYVDFHIGSLVPLIPSYVKDTTDFLSKLESLNSQYSFDSNTLLVTVDVKSLYTNIPHNESVTAASNFLNTNAPSYYPPTSFICTLIKFVLSHNYFEFNDQLFLQCHGLAMGTKMAPNLANIFMDNFERLFLSQSSLSPVVWYRFIDDIFMIWSHGRDSLDNFLSTLNSFHATIGADTIKFSHEISDTSIPFLDVTVSLQNGKLESDLYSKTTDTHQYLNYNSYHPPHTIKSLPYSLALRIIKICSLRTTCFKRLQELKIVLIRRQYPIKIINRAFKKALAHSRCDLLNSNNPQQIVENKIPLVLPFFLDSSKILSNIVHKNTKILRRSYTMSEILHHQHIVLAFKRCQNIGDVITHSSLSNNHEMPGFHMCSETNCKLHCYTYNTQNFIHILSQRSYKITSSIDCNTSNVIYLITCKKCDLQYVGETGRALSVRMKEHLADIRYNRLKPISTHFNSTDHLISDFSFLAMEHLKQHDMFYRQIKEAIWINKLNTVHSGLNCRVSEELECLTLSHTFF